MATIIEDVTLYSVEDVSQILSVTTASVRNYIKQGHLKGQKVLGRWIVLEDELNSFINKL